MATRRNAVPEWAQNELVALEAAAAAQQAQDTETEEQMEETPSDRVSTLLTLATGEDRAYIACYRLNKGQLEYCKRYAPTEFEDGSFDLIRDDFGPGEYELRLYGTHPKTNRWAVRARTRIQMAEVPKRAATEPVSNGLNQVLSTIAQGQQQMLDALVAMKQAPQKDPMGEMTKMLSMMTMMREAMGLNQVQPASTRSSIGEIVDAIKELRGAAAEVMPEKEESNDLIGMLPKVLDLVAQGQQVQQQVPMQPMYQDDQSAVLSPVTLPPAFAAQATNKEADDMNPITLIKLRGYLKTLVGYAEKKAPTSEAAQFVYEKLPDDLIEMMELPTWFELLGAVAPEVKAHQDYLTTVRNEALGMFQDDESGAQAA
jgi:hypothetical protein